MKLQILFNISRKSKNGNKVLNTSLTFSRIQKYRRTIRSEYSGSKFEKFSVKSGFKTRAREISLATSPVQTKEKTIVEWELSNLQRISIK